MDDINTYKLERYFDCDGFLYSAEMELDEGGTWLPKDEVESILSDYDYILNAEKENHEIELHMQKEIYEERIEHITKMVALLYSAVTHQEE